MALNWFAGPTPEQVHSAKAAMVAERRALEQRGVFVIGCTKPGCMFTASELSEGRALRKLSAHLISVHGVTES